MKLRSYLVITATALSVAVLILLSAVMYNNSADKVSEMLEKNERIRIGSTYAEIAYKLSTAEKICESLRQSDRLYGYVKTWRNESEITWERVKAYNNAKNMLYLLCASNSFVKNIFLVDKDCRYIEGKQQLQNETFLRMSAYQENGIALYYPKADASRKEGYLNLDEHIYYAMNLSNDTDCLILVVLGDEINTVFNRFSDNVAIYNEDGEQIYACGEKLEMFSKDAEHLSEKDGYVLYADEIEGTLWSVRYALPRSDYYSDYRMLVIAYVISFTCAVLFSVAVSRIVSRLVMKRLSGTLSALHRYKQHGIKEKMRIKNETHTLPIRTLFYICYILTTLPAFLSFLLLFQFGSNNVVETQKRESYTLAANSIANTFRTTFEQSEHVMTRIIYDDGLIDLLGISANESFDDEMIQFLRENVTYGLFDSYVDVYDADYNLVCSNNLLSDEKMEAMPEQSEWTMGYDILGKSRVLLSGSIARNAYSSVSTPLAYVKISKSVDSLYSMLRGATVYAEDVSLLFTDDTYPEYRQGNGTAYITVSVENTPCRIVMQYDTPSFIHNAISSLKDSAFILLLLLAAISVVVFLTFKLVFPMEKLYTVMRNLVPGDPEARMKAAVIDEVDLIVESFNEMADRIDLLIDDLIVSNEQSNRLENEKRNAEITALQSQINPHFLSNTIQAISTIVRDGETEKACSMLLSMNDLFRYAISRPDNFITVREELAYAKAYVSLMNLRFPRIEVVWQIDDAVLKEKTIKLILQPLLENAIFHGVQPALSEGGIPVGIITVRSILIENDLCFIVSDNGIGMDEQQLASLRDSMDMAHPSDGVHIGLRNVSSRLKLHYGNNHSLKIISEKHKGTQIYIRIKDIF